MNLRRITKHLLITALCGWLATMAWQTHKPLPAGVHISSPSVLLPESDVRFLSDLTYQTPQGERISEQTIFDAVFKQIDQAQHFIVLDFFLINDDMGDKSLRPLSRQLADHLLARKRAVPDIKVLLITDPINDVYDGAFSDLLKELETAGIAIVRTDLTKLRDSNPGYSAIWRGLIQWWGNSTQGGWLMNPFDGGSEKITLRSWLSLLNFKANHRKVMVTDNAAGEWVALVTSGNPHDASSAHSNVAVQFTGEPARAVFDSELEIARFSGWTSDMPSLAPVIQASAPGSVELSYLTEGAIRERVLREIRATRAGDVIRMAMFYLSDRLVIDALKQAAQRDVTVQLILDPNKDAFGIEKDGVPNRPVANELVTDTDNRVEVRWYRTHGEQFHTKLLTVRRQRELFATLGSANFTRRNLADYNLEANVAMSLPPDTALAAQFDAYFNRLWNGDAANPEYVAPFGAYRDESAGRYWRYRVMEATGLSTF